MDRSQARYHTATEALYLRPSGESENASSAVSAASAFWLHLDRRPGVPQRRDSDQQVPWNRGGTGTMSGMDDEPRVEPLVADETVRAALWAYIDREGTTGLTEYATDLGLYAPDNQPAWELTMFAAPDDSDVDLYWLLEPEDADRVG